ncbi:hypothetical protein BN1012_Phect965 [Candidatus Phaeomarinobacter ectocarpi]|uniref:Uncharacterized protein n=1 Tax=Candidatus Phaeomarinibacter ectocarpi TaxID=1458461 RepID=X5MEE2_9HYPH|nr:hypothetical protein BN1012_Phect965 [Candidatus Phaeomarinobacter ectocarpi]
MWPDRDAAFANHAHYHLRKTKRQALQIRKSIGPVAPAADDPTSIQSRIP